MMLEAGFKYIAPGTFYHGADQILAFDLYPKNVKFNLGETLPIDPVVQRATPDFARFIAANYARLPDYQNAEARLWGTAL